MYKWFERYFAFSRRELSGICVLGVLLFFFWLIPKLLPHGKHDPIDMAKHIKKIEHFLVNVDERKPSIAKTDSASIGSKKPNIDVEYFTFDPNGLAIADWKRLGLSDGQIRVIKNYEAKGGAFRKKEDLKNIYSLSDKDYVRLEPYIQIRPRESARSASTMPEDTQLAGADGKSAALNATPRLSIELNTTDSVELQRLPGIGSVFASRIVRLRDRLGGFHHISQLMDVYGVDTARFEGLKEYIYVDSSRLKKISINSADYERLRSHPFISPKLANAMVQYRKQHGPYQSLSDLLQIAIIDESIFRKIVPYLSLSDD